MNRDLISIIVPAYNIQSYLSRCLESLCRQTYSNLEIIVVDDGSTDGTGKILDAWAAQDARVIALHQPNSGVTCARLSGLKYASGNYIGFVDGDDIAEPDMFEMLLSDAKAYHADIAHCGYQMVFPDGHIDFYHGTGKILEQDHKKGLIDLLEGTMIEPGLWNKLYHRSLAERLMQDSRMDYKIRINEDLLMNYYLFSVARSSVFMDVCKYHYLVRKDSVTRTELNHNRIYDPIKVKKIICEDVPDILQSCAERAYLNTCVNVCNSLVLAEQKKDKKDLESIRKIIKKNRGKINLLNRKQQLLALLILYIPSIYKVLYRYYAKYLMQNKYE